MKLRIAVIYFAVVTLVAAAMTGFYFVHEDLPKPVRAPTSLILAPVAIVDGACFALGVPGIYGKVVPVFVVNAITAAIACWALTRYVGWWQRRRQARHAKPGASQGHGGM